MIPRKKVCTTCGRKLWLREFYPSRGQCKDCIREIRRKHYLATAKVPDWVKVNGRSQVVRHSGYSTSLYWGEQKMRDFKKEFPFHINADLAVKFGCSSRTISRLAERLGLTKDPEWMARVTERNRQAATFASRIRRRRAINL